MTYAEFCKSKEKEGFKIEHTRFGSRFVRGADSYFISDKDWIHGVWLNEQTKYMESF